MRLRFRFAAGVFTVIALLFTFFSSTANSEERTPRIAIAYDIGFKGDGGFNDAVGAALEIAKRRYDLVEPFVRELPTSGTAIDRLTKLRFLAKSGYTLIIAVDVGYRETVRRVSMEYPDTQFAIINDQSLGQMNISNISFDEFAAARVAGTIAAMRSKSKTIAIIGGTDALNSAFEAGARGVKTLKLAYSGDSEKLLAELGSADIVYSLWDRDAKVFQAIMGRAPRTSYIARNPDQYFAKMEGNKRVIAVIEKRLEKPVSQLVRLGLGSRALIDVIDEARGVYGRSYGINNGGYRLKLSSDFTSKQRAELRRIFPRLELS